MVVFLFLVIGFFVLVAVIIRLSTRLRYITFPVYDQVIKEAQSKAGVIINDAQVQSRSVISSAQETAEKIISERKDENEKFREKYTKHFDEIVTQGRDILAKQSTELAGLSKNMVDEFKKSVLTAEVLIHKNSDLISETLSEESEQLKRAFADISAKTQEEQQALIEETKRHVSEEIAKEISMAHDVIATYKKERLALLDREVVGLIEETARIALNRTFSLREHRDQILVALDEAKKEGVFDK